MFFSIFFDKNNPTPPSPFGTACARNPPRRGLRGCMGEDHAWEGTISATAVGLKIRFLVSTRQGGSDRAQSWKTAHGVATQQKRQRPRSRKRLTYLKCLGTLSMASTGEIDRKLTIGHRTVQRPLNYKCRSFLGSANSFHQKKMGTSTCLLHVMRRCRRPSFCFSFLRILQIW